MVLKLQFHLWDRVQTLIPARQLKAFTLRVVMCVMALFAAPLSVEHVAWARDGQTASALLQNAREFNRQGLYFKSARYAFAAAQEAGSASVENEAYSWVTVGLAQSGMSQSAVYFLIKTLQTGDRAAIRRALTQTEEIVSHVGADLLRKYLVQHTKTEDYDFKNRSVFLYTMGKESLLSGHASQTNDWISGVSASSSIYPYALQLRGTARAILGQNEQAIDDFEKCTARADQLVDLAHSQKDLYGSNGVEQSVRQAEDLSARCYAGIARTYYQMKRYREADEAYDRIPKASFVWTDILFEQAWNAFAQGEYNRTLGRLVSYKSPALQFVFNPEVDVLRAQSFLVMCLYQDANDVINEFNSRYTRLGEEVKRFVESNSGSLSPFYEAGKQALKSKLHAENSFNRLMNRFVRSPYFQTLVAAEKAVYREQGLAEKWGAQLSGVSRDPGQGFPGFLKQVQEWRARSIRMLGGSFVKNSLIDYHSVLISDYEKIAFIKLEMLSRAKEKLMNSKRTWNDRDRGMSEPSRKDYQYYWSFNGEFWNDELGDYIFGLQSECDRS